MNLSNYHIKTKPLLVTKSYMDNVLEAIAEDLDKDRITEKEFDMSTFESMSCSTNGRGKCGTTHCIGGWVADRMGTVVFSYGKDRFVRTSNPLHAYGVK